VTLEHLQSIGGSGRFEHGVPIGAKPAAERSAQRIFVIDEKHAPRFRVFPSHLQVHGYTDKTSLKRISVLSRGILPRVLPAFCG